MKIDDADQFEEKDERLVWQAFLSGDDQGLIFLYRNYVQLLFRYGQQFTKRYEFIQDCIQELFYELINKRDRLSSAQSIKAYLFASLKRRIIRGLKREEQFVLEEQGFNFSSADSPLSLAGNLKEQAFQTIYQKINQLPTSQREVIFLYFYEGMGYSEIAEIMNIRIASARTLAYRALDNLHSALKPFVSSFYILITALSIAAII